MGDHQRRQSTASPSGSCSYNDPAVRVLLCDNQPIYLLGLAASLEAESRLRVVGEATDAVSAIALAFLVRPHVVVTADDVPRGGSAKILAELRPYPTRVMVLSSEADVRSATSALNAGAGAYLLRSRPSVHLISAILSVANGEINIDSSVTLDLIRQMRIGGQLSAHVPPVDRFGNLTRRQRQVVALAATGMTNSQIADRLNLRVATIKSHVHAALRTLALRSRDDLWIVTEQDAHIVGSPRPPDR